MVEDWEARRVSFGDEAAAYATGRPSYPRAALEWVLPPGAQRVLDLAAGTGRLTRPLLDLGLDVVAVEPSDAMRAHVPAEATVLAGTAERIPVDDASVDAVLVGQAFHWFDVPRAMTEIRRVLRPGGTVGLLWNLLDDSDTFVSRFAALLSADEVASAIQPHPPPPYPAEGGMTAPTRRVFRFTEPYDVDRLLAYVLSRSRTILLPPPERDSLLESVRAITPAGDFELPIVCEAWRGEKDG